MKDLKAHNITKFWKLTEAERNDYYIPEEISTSYEIRECGEKVVSIASVFRKFKQQFIYSPPIDYSGGLKEPFLRESAAKLLAQASMQLPQGVLFKISEGLRPLSYQKRIFKLIFEDIQKANPTRDEKWIWEETTKYVADPNLCPPHTTGGAIDLTLATLDGKSIDMGCPINSVGSISNTNYGKLSRQHKENRRMLFDAMTKVGFVNLPTEWWHYSYGDQYWALFKGKKYAIYGKVNK